MVSRKSRALVDLERWRSAQNRRAVLVGMHGRDVEDGGLETGSRAGGKEDVEDQDRVQSQGDARC